MTIQRMMAMFKVKLPNRANINLAYTPSILLKACYI